MIKIPSFFFLLIFLLNFLKTSAQEKDAGIWLSVAVEKKISSFLDVGLSQEFRFNENISELGTAFTEAGFQYKLFRKLRTGANYRFIQDRKLDDSYRLRHRYSFFLTYIVDVNRFSFRIREKFQSRYSEVFSSEDGKIPKNILRSRLMATYDLNKKYRPYIAGEIYYELNNPEGNEIDKLRCKAGFDYEFDKHHSMALGYLIDQQVNRNNPLTDYVVEVGYNFTF